MSEDMSDMIQKMSEILKNNGGNATEEPLQNILRSFTNMNSRKQWQ